MITPTQMRAARAMLDLSQGDVAKSLGIAANTLSNIESGKTDVPASRLKEMQAFYESHDLEFTDYDGVRRKSREVTVLKGHEGFEQFRQLVLSSAKGGSIDICVSNVDERSFGRWGSAEVNASYKKEIASIPNLKFRILIKEGDTFFSAKSYAEYRWVSSRDFGDIPFYVFGNKIAIFSFKETTVEIFVIEHLDIANFYRKQFEDNWSKAVAAEE